MKAEAAIVAGGAEWRETLDDALSRIPMLVEGTPADLTLLFVSDAYGADFQNIVSEVRRRVPGGVLTGCSGQGIIGPGREIEGRAALSLQVFSLPGVELTATRLSPEDVAGERFAKVWTDKLGQLRPEQVNAWLYFVDPFSINGDQLLELFATVNRGVPVIGGLASGDFQRRGTYVFLNDEVYNDGAVGVAIAGDYEVRTIVSQGAAPIGETWTITDAHENFIDTIGMRPALDVLTETFHSLPADIQDRARRNLLVGLAMDEYRDEFRRGDFLIRNLVGVERQSGSIAVGAYPRVGQTIQFQLRDPIAADEELREMLLRTRLELGDQEPVGALLCACNGRGIGLFGEPNHDAQALEERFAALPVAGFFCNGEIGPVGKTNYLHGFTASIALILPKGNPSEA
jgi:small ligand-binding sensory domain FIST